MTIERPPVETMYVDGGGARLEVLFHPAAEAGHRPPLLFVHGAFAGAWCWAEHFLPYFASRGFDAYALSLRGHGRSDGRARLAWTSLADYSEDLAGVVRAIDRAPILVGHSMGAMVVQRYLEGDARAAAVVLLASVPPAGLAGAMTLLALRDPILFMQLGLLHAGGAQLASQRSARRSIFSPELPARLAARYLGQMQPESQRVVWDLWGYDLPRSGRCGDYPVLVLGGAGDALVDPLQVRATARVFDTEAQIVPGVAHAMMLDAGWRDVAGRIAAGLRSAGL